jgi:hypothetical protein
LKQIMGISVGMCDAFVRTEIHKNARKKHEGNRLLGGPRCRWGTRYRSWLKHYATRWKVAGSILDEVVGFFN